VWRLVAALSSGDSSPVRMRRQVGVTKSGDKSPHSKYGSYAASVLLSGSDIGSPTVALDRWSPHH